jgi:hypothetical protein
MRLLGSKEKVFNISHWALAIHHCKPNSSLIIKLVIIDSDTHMMMPLSSKVWIA